MNTALKKAATATYQLINPEVKVNASAAIENSSPRDIWGSIKAMVEKSDGNEKEASSFDLVQEPGHGKVTHDPRKAPKFDIAELKSDVDKLLAKANSKNAVDDEWGDYEIIPDDDINLNKFHMLFGNFLRQKIDFDLKMLVSAFEAEDPQYYKYFQALRFLKVAQGEEENIHRLNNELADNQYVRYSNVKVDLRDTKNKQTTEQPLALFAFDNYCHNKNSFFYDKQGNKTISNEINFLVKFGRIDKVEENGFTYILQDDDKATLALYEGNSSEVKIPATANGCSITKVGEYCFPQGKFNENEKLKKVIIPSSIEEISEGAFKNCDALTSIEFEPNSRLKIIRKDAFRDCKTLRHITIPKSVEQIEGNAFGSCKKLESITFENREKPIFIEPDAFSSCLFSNITFPHNVEFGDMKLLSLPKNLKTIAFIGSGEIKKENILKFLPRGNTSNFFKHNIEKLFDGKDSIKFDDKLTIDLWGGYLSEDGTLDLSSFDIQTFKTFKIRVNNCVTKIIGPQGI